MLNRRHIRIKVMQSLYAFNGTESDDLTKDEKFLLEIMKPISFNDDQTIENITLKLNQLLEKMVIRNPHQWIWSHNRWK